MAVYAAHTTNYNTYLLTAQKTPKKTGATEKSLPLGKWKFRDKEVRRMGQKQKMVRQKEQQDQKAEEQKNTAPRPGKTLGCNFL